jgi:sugar O-acyltransferase (sialic acid O-acetyltransferase NeuD family)
MRAMLVIMGAGGMGREAAAWAADCGRGEDLLGFIDDDPARAGAALAGLPVLGDRGWLDERRDVEVAVAVGQPRLRLAIAAELRARGHRLATLVHPSAVIGPRVSVGEGSIVCPGVVLTCDVVLGTNVIVNYGAAVGHDGEVGDGAFLGPGATLAGNVTVGELSDVGLGASVLQCVSIGARSVVGAGAVVVRDVGPDTTVVGVPARPMKRAEP